MSRDFESSSSQYLEFTSAIKSATPFTFACWIKPESVGTAGTIFSITTSASADNHFKLDVAATGAIRFRARTTASSDALTVGTVSAGTWYFVAARSTSATNRHVQLTTTRVQNTTSRVPSGMNRTSLGRSAESAGVSYFDGLIAYPTFWNTAISDANLDSLAGMSAPSTIDSANQISRWLLSGSSPEPDSVGSNSWTVTGAAYSTDEPFAIGALSSNQNFTLLGIG